MNMTKQKIIILSVLLVLAMTLTPLNVFAAPDSVESTVITLTAGQNSFRVNDIPVKAEKPYMRGQHYFIPLRAVLEAMGAEVVWEGDGNVKVLFRNISIDLTLGENKIEVNQSEKMLPIPPETRNGSVMIPVELLTACFGNDLSINITGGKLSIILKSDGALSDLSFLTGGINKPRAGNSYFGWSIDIPRGSRISYHSFNSRVVQIDNEHRGFGLDISVEARDGRSLEDYYAGITGDPGGIIGGELQDFSIHPDKIPGYIELLYTDEYDEAIYRRIFAGDAYFYDVIITSFNQSDPGLLSKDAYINGILDSFSLGYSGNRPDTAELSKVQFGLVEYNNYISTASIGKKLLAWQMSVLPELDVVQGGTGNSFRTEFREGLNESVSVEIFPAKGQNDVSAYGKSVEAIYSSNFNPALFKLLKSESLATAGLNSYNLVYDVTMGNKHYTYDERVLISGGLIYDITLKIKSDSYEKEKAGYERMLETFKPAAKDTAALLADLEKYTFNLEKGRLGKDDTPVKYTNDEFGWSAEFPGSWQKNPSSGQSVEAFYHRLSGGVVMVEAVSKNSDGSRIPVESRFETVRLVAAMAMESVSTQSLDIKGRKVSKIKYRIEDEKYDNYADVYLYILDADAYSYCFMSSVPDITASGPNKDILERIWKSFELVPVKK